MKPKRLFLLFISCLCLAACKKNNNHSFQQTASEKGFQGIPDHAINASRNSRLNEHSSNEVSGASGEPDGATSRKERKNRDAPTR